MVPALPVLAADPGRRAWLDDLDAVKITGSNGKGTTAAVLAALFAELAIPTGLYTSPHLRRPTERVRIDGSEVRAGELEDAWRRAQQIAQDRPDGDRFGAFELLTVAALELFAGRVEAVVAEAGIGGRFDATRAIPGQLVGLSSLDLEHTGLLGSSLEEIAYDKADLCPDGGTLIAGAGTEPALRRRLRGYTRLRGIELVMIDELAELKGCRFDGPRMRFDMELRGEPILDVTMSAAGRHQWSNAVLALLLAEAWTRRHRPELAPDALLAAWRRVLERIRLPGQFDRAAAGPDVYIDFCHTPRAAARLAETAAEALAGRGILLVLGVSQDKELEALAEPLLDLAGAVVLTRARHRGMDPARLEEHVRTAYPELERRRCDELEDALALARREARRRGMAVLVAGGLFLGVEAAEVLAGRDPARLQFL